MKFKNRLQKIERAVQKITPIETPAATPESTFLWKRSLQTLAEALTEIAGEPISAAEVEPLLQELR